LLSLRFWQARGEIPSPALCLPVVTTDCELGYSSLWHDQNKDSFLLPVLLLTPGGT
jgi:hypothetical protein